MSGMKIAGDFGSCGSSRAYASLFFLFCGGSPLPTLDYCYQLDSPELSQMRRLGLSPASAATILSTSLSNDERRNCLGVMPTIPR